MKPDSVRRLRGPILRSVSRSFYLSIRILPGGLRDPVALAYLLARATDTVADTAEIDAGLRARELAVLAAQIQGDGGDVGSLPHFAALQKDDAERVLIEAVPACLAWLEEMPNEDKREVRAVLARICEGQTLDVQRFANPANLTALARAEDLDRYTYLVAGCVGEFWTQVCFRHLPRFATRESSEMTMLGVDYGKGLQLVNILRDLGADLRAGRCYLAEEELSATGISLALMASDPTPAWPIVDAWRKRAEQKLGSGIEYACAIRSMRVRLGTVLPALIGARTLALLREAGPEVFARKIKVSRTEVRKIIFDTIRSLASPPALRAAFTKLSS